MSITIALGRGRTPAPERMFTEIAQLMLAMPHEGEVPKSWVQSLYWLPRQLRDLMPLIPEDTSSEFVVLMNPTMGVVAARRQVVAEIMLEGVWFDGGTTIRRVTVERVAGQWRGTIGPLPENAWKEPGNE